MQNASARRGRAIGEGDKGRTLVIGCGFIGSHIVEELTAAGRPVAVLTRSRPDHSVASLLPEEDLHVGDASDPDLLATALEGIDRVVFTAGGLLPAASEQNPDLDQELTLAPVRAVLDALRERPGTSLVYLSSGGTVYGEPSEIPVSERAATRPLGVYGRLHLECEAEVMRCRREGGLPARILRCSTVYGERQQPERGQGAVVTFMSRIEHGIPLDLYGGGTTVRDYVYVGDVADVVLKLLDRTDGEPILNVGSGRGTSLAELLRLVEAEVGRPAEVVEHPSRGFEVKAVVLDVSRLRNLIDFAPTPLEIGIRRTHSWLAQLESQRA